MARGNNRVVDESMFLYDTPVAVRDVDSKM